VVTGTLSQSSPLSSFLVAWFRPSNAKLSQVLSKATELKSRATNGCHWLFSRFREVATCCRFRLPPSAHKDYRWVRSSLCYNFVVGNQLKTICYRPEWCSCCASWHYQLIYSPNQSKCSVNTAHYYHKNTVTAGLPINWLFEICFVAPALAASEVKLLTFALSGSFAVQQACSVFKMWTFVSCYLWKAFPHQRPFQYCAVAPFQARSLASVPPSWPVLSFLSLIGSCYASPVSHSHTESLSIENPNLSKWSFSMRNPF